MEEEEGEKIRRWRRGAGFRKKTEKEKKKKK